MPKYTIIKSSEKAIIEFLILMHFTNELLACARVTKMSEVLALKAFIIGETADKWTSNI